MLHIRKKKKGQQIADLLLANRLLFRPIPMHFSK